MKTVKDLSKRKRNDQPPSKKPRLDEEIPEEEAGITVLDTAGNSDSEESTADGDFTVAESIDEKRVRVAKEYIEKLKKLQAEAGVTDEAEDEEMDPIARRLRLEASVASLRVLPEIVETYKNKQYDSSSVRFMRGHKLSPTCVTLTGDDTTAYTGSKDCCIVRWDIETGKKIVWKGKRNDPSLGGHTDQILTIACSTDGRFVATSGLDKSIKIWDARTNKHIGDLAGHFDVVTSLAFQMGTTTLYSGSTDRTVKVWNAEELAYIETLYGHESTVQSVDSLYLDRVLSSGNDKTVRLWKVPEESQLLFMGHTYSIDTARLLTDDTFISGSQDGDLAMWSTRKRTPVQYFRKAHGGAWISSVGALRFSSVGASGSNDGYVKLWNCNVHSRTFEMINQIPMTGFVNGIVFSSTGKFMVAAVGQEHRLGRWQKVKGAKNGLAVINLLQDSEVRVVRNFASNVRDFLTTKKPYEEDEDEEDEEDANENGDDESGDSSADLDSESDDADHDVKNAFDVTRRLPQSAANRRNGGAVNGGNNNKKRGRK